MAAERDSRHAANRIGDGCVFLLGFMGAGKTSVGQELADLLALPFVDLDRVVENRADCSIAAIFDGAGEDAFRDLEHRSLQETLSQGEQVVALGGGAWMAIRNRRLLSGMGPTVWLNPSFSTIVSRLDSVGLAGRPLFGDLEEAESLYIQRKLTYRKADLRIDIDRAETPAQVAARIARQLRRHPRAKCVT
jgi:shikimate kinase